MASHAQLVRKRDPEAIRDIASRPILVRPDNFVERPWGGTKLARAKGVPGDASIRYGEAFEIAAFPSDGEAAAHPSVVMFDDGSELPLPDLLEHGGDQILGAAHIAAFGPVVPLLPKTLDIEELLSVQAHPSGNPEAYIILEAEPGATIRLGFSSDVDRASLEALWTEGRTLQERMLEARTPELEARLEKIYWETLDLMNSIPVEPGRVIFNASPDGRNAEVHSLGNPEKKEILMLEVRRPGVTYRAWDHVRFPLREINVGAALDAMSLMGRAAESFFVQPLPVEGRPGVFTSVRCDAFVIDHLRPTPNSPVRTGARGVQTLHVLRGRVALGKDGGNWFELGGGRSALVPDDVVDYELVAMDDDVEVVEVTLPDTARPAA